MNWEMCRRTGGGALLATAVAVLCPHEARAEGSIGVGTRISVVHGASDSATGPTRLFGGMLRARLSPRTALELAFDFRSQVNENLAERIRDYPVQGSLLMHLVRSTMSPYLVAGAGWYSQQVETLPSAPMAASVSTTTRTVGYHAGVGGELQLGKHAAVHLDYRYTFIRLGEPTDDSEPGAIPLPGTQGLQERLKLSHQGSVWTSGLTFYF